MPIQIVFTSLISKCDSTSHVHCLMRLNDANDIKYHCIYCKVGMNLYNRRSASIHYNTHTRHLLFV